MIYCFKCLRLHKNKEHEITWENIFNDSYIREAETIVNGTAYCRVHIPKLKGGDSHGN